MSQPEQVRVLIVENQPSIIEGIRSVLGTFGHQVVGEAQDLGAVDQLTELDPDVPDVAIVDINLGSRATGLREGIEAGRRLRAAFGEELPLIFLSSDEPEEFAGDEGVITIRKPAGGREVLQAIGLAVASRREAEEEDPAA